MKIAKILKMRHVFMVRTKPLKKKKVFSNKENVYNILNIVHVD